nr:MAG TPA: hypothetical protein [Caudoviricetes sp.]
MWWNYSLKDCAIFYNTYGTDYLASKITYPFFWVAAKQVGFGVKYCTLQTPTDAPTIPDMFAQEFAGAVYPISEIVATDVELNVIFPSAEAGVASMAACFGDILTYAGFVLYSHAAQTIPSSLAKEFIGVQQDTNLPQGWSYISLYGSADHQPVAKTESEIQDIVIAGGHGIDPDVFQATAIQFSAQDFTDEQTPQETAEIIATFYNGIVGYFHSYFKPEKDILYEPVSMAKRFEMTFNLTEAQTT